MWPRETTRDPSPPPLPCISQPAPTGGRIRGQDKGGCKVCAGLGVGQRRLLGSHQLQQTLLLRPRDALGDGRVKGEESSSGGCESAVAHTPWRSQRIMCGIPATCDHTTRRATSSRASWSWREAGLSCRVRGSRRIAPCTNLGLGEGQAQTRRVLGPLLDLISDPRHVCPPVMGKGVFLRGGLRVQDSPCPHTKTKGLARGVLERVDCGAQGDAGAWLADREAQWWRERPCLSRCGWETESARRRSRAARQPPSSRVHPVKAGAEGGLSGAVVARRRPAPVRGCCATRLPAYGRRQWLGAAQERHAELRPRRPPEKTPHHRQPASNAPAAANNIRQAVHGAHIELRHVQPHGQQHMQHLQNQRVHFAGHLEREEREREM